MRTLEQQITQYAAYHRDRRNIATHFVGVPMIVFSVILALCLIGIPQLTVLGPCPVAVIAVLLACLYYVKLDTTLGIAMFVTLAANLWLAAFMTSSFSTGTSGAIAALCFVVGWIIQFIGHKFEGMKPAFIDDMAGLIIGPLFVMTEVFFLLKLKPDLQRYVEARVGPTLAARNGAPIGPAVAHTATSS